MATDTGTKKTLIDANSTRLNTSPASPDFFLNERRFVESSVPVGFSRLIAAGAPRSGIRVHSRLLKVFVFFGHFVALPSVASEFSTVESRFLQAGLPIWFSATGGQAGRGHPRFKIRLVSVDETVGKLRQLGADVLSEPRDSPWGRRAVLTDPDGLRIEITASPGVGGMPEPERRAWIARHALPVGQGVPPRIRARHPGVILFRRMVRKCPEF